MYWHLHFCSILELHVRYGDFGLLIQARLWYDWRHGLSFFLDKDPRSYAIFNLVLLRPAGWRGWHPVHVDGSPFRLTAFWCHGWLRALGAAFGYARLRGVVVLV